MTLMGNPLLSVIMQFLIFLVFSCLTLMRFLVESCSMTNPILFNATTTIATSTEPITTLTTTTTTTTTTLPPCTISDTNGILTLAYGFISLACQNSVCLIPEGSSMLGKVFCDSNEVMIGDQCLTLSTNHLSFRCSNGQLSITIESHLFGDIDRWNAVNYTTITGAESISCQNCPDNCVFSFAHERGPTNLDFVDRPFFFPTNSLCRSENTFYDLNSGNLAYGCKVQHGQTTTVSSCADDIEVLTTEAVYDDLNVREATFECNDGVLTAVGTIGGVEVVGNVVGIVCDDDGDPE